MAPRSCSTTIGREPERELVDEEQLGRVMVAMASASICCWPPERLAARSSRREASVGKAVSASSIMSASCSPRRRPCQAATRRLSSTRRLGKIPSPPGTWATPSRAISSGGRWVMSRPSKTMAPWSASTTPPMAAQQGGLAGAVRADEGDDLPFGDLDGHVGQHDDAVVADGELADGEEGQPAGVAVEQHLRPCAHGGPARRARRAR